MSTFIVKQLDPWSHSGTSLQGYISTSYDKLVHVFGPPTMDETSADNKVDIEWVLQIQEDNDEPITATIYNWKDYDGGKIASESDVYNWHIGGNNPIDAITLKQAFEQLLEMEENV